MVSSNITGMNKFKFYSVMLAATLSMFCLVILPAILEEIMCVFYNKIFVIKFGMTSML